MISPCFSVKEADALAPKKYLGRICGGEKYLGCKHPDTLQTLHQLGLDLMHLEKHEEAETLCRGAMECREEILGKMKWTHMVLQVL